MFETISLLTMGELVTIALIILGVVAAFFGLDFLIYLLKGNHKRIDIICVPEHLHKRFQREFIHKVKTGKFSDEQATKFASYMVDNDLGFEKIITSCTLMLKEKYGQKIPLDQFEVEVEAWMGLAWQAAILGVVGSDKKSLLENYVHMIHTALKVNNMSEEEFQYWHDLAM